MPKTRPIHQAVSMGHLLVTDRWTDRTIASTALTERRGGKNCPRSTIEVRPAALPSVLANPNLILDPDL